MTPLQRFVLTRAIWVPLFSGMVGVGVYYAWPGAPEIAPQVAASLAAVLWVPTSLARIRSMPLRDLDADAWLADLRARATEWGLYAASASVLVVLLGRALAATPAAADLWTGVLAAVGAFMTGRVSYVGWLATRAGQAAFAEGEGDDVQVERLLGPIVHHPRFLVGHSYEAVLIPLARVRLRRGQPDEALALLDRARRKDVPALHVLRASILIGRDELEPAREILQRWKPRPSEALAREELEGLLDLYEERSDRILDRPDPSEEEPPRVRALLLMQRAAAHKLAGQNRAARQALDRSPVKPAEMAWVKEVWPRWWQLLQQIEAPAPRG